MFLSYRNPLVDLLCKPIKCNLVYNIWEFASCRTTLGTEEVSKFWKADFVLMIGDFNANLAIGQLMIPQLQRETS